MIRVTINGEEQSIEPQRIDALLRTLGLNPSYVAVEVNRELVKRDRFAGVSIRDGDQIEIVQFVGGG
ncbi:MAG: hypothetical protein GMKNLPBB_00250 [Myxococcota bacterium]|nr:hypothetical protein [Myxococcota bacterium]